MMDAEERWTPWYHLVRQYLVLTLGVGEQCWIAVEVELVEVLVVEVVLALAVEIAKKVISKGEKTQVTGKGLYRWSLQATIVSMCLCLHFHHEVDDALPPQ